MRIKLMKVTDNPIDVVKKLQDEIHALEYELNF